MFVGQKGAAVGVENDGAQPPQSVDEQAFDCIFDSVVMGRKVSAKPKAAPPHVMTMYVHIFDDPRHALRNHHCSAKSAQMMS